MMIKRLWLAFSNAFPRLSCEINYARRYRRWEADLWLTPRFCTRDANAVDVGANMGIYSRWLAKYAKHVHSFECNPALQPRLARFLPKNATLHKIALSNQTGQSMLRVDPGNSGIGTIEQRNTLDPQKNAGIKKIESVAVPITTLDELDLSNVSFVKIDVEGHELEVLRGSAQFLLRESPVLLIEIEDRHCPGNLIEVPELLSKMDYQVSACFDGELKPILSVESAASNGINNFWFIPKTVRHVCE